MRALKTSGAAKEEIKAAVEKLSALKSELADKTPKLPSKKAFSRPVFEDLLKRRFFYAPSFEIYGGKRERTKREITHMEIHTQKRESESERARVSE